MTGRLLTGREVADQLGVSTKTVLRWALDGRLPSIRLSNRAIRFRETELDAWLAQRATPTTPERVTDQDGRRPPTSLVVVTDHQEPPSWPSS
jgi:excisionase family DNA binding protein